MALGVVARIPVHFGNLGFATADLGVALASLGVWWMAGEGRVSPARLHTLGLVYEVAICFALALTAYWSWTLDLGFIPPLIWVPTVIILFPLIMPGPPRRMLAAAIAAGLMSPLALGLLDLWGKVTSERGRLHPVGRQLRVRCRIRLHGRARGVPAGARRSRRRVSWAAIGWRSGWARAAWARCGAPGTACWPGRPRSS